MNQKNIFTGIAFILLVQGVVFFIMCGKLAADAYPGLDKAGVDAVARVIEVIGMLSLLVALISYSVRDMPQVLWAYTIGFALVLIVTLKHMFLDHINVPVFAVVIQGAITVLCAYLWSQNKS